MYRSLLLAAFLTALVAGNAQADNFSFSIGSGYRGHHHGHHHHHGCYGPAFGISLWSPPPPRYVYVAPPPVVHYVQPPVIQQPVIIQQPPPVNSYGAVTSSPNVASNSLPAPPTRTVATGSPVVIRNSGNKGVPVAFLVDDKSEELRDGQTRTYSGSSHVIEYDRGGNLGTARYELTGGLYSFVVGNNGWELLRDSNTTRTADRPAVKRNELPFEVNR
jgi:hypothetical protein